MAEEQNSLREAIGRIVGGLGTTSAISNTPFDPNAEQNAANAATLASAKAANDVLAAEMAPVAPVAAASAARPYSGSYTTGPYSVNYAIGSQDDPKKMISVTSQNYNDPWVQESIKGLSEKAGAVAGGAWKSLAASPSQLSKPNYREKYVSSDDAWKKWNAGEFAPQRAYSSSSPPVNPGPNAPWQKSQQYWKDLAAYKGT